MRMLLPSATVAALLFACPAPAQDGSESTGSRTPENAQRFLTEVIGSTLVTSGSLGRNFSVVSYNIPAIRHEGTCTSILEGIPRNYVLRDDSGRMINNYAGNQGNPSMLQPHQKLIGSLGIAQAPYRIEWGKLAAIVQSPPGPIDGKPQQQTLLLQTNAWSIRVYFVSEELTSRARLAMETLKKACDPVADTGF